MTQQQIYSVIAAKYNISFIEARKICNSSFRFIREKININDNKSILLANILRFKVKKKYEK